MARVQLRFWMSAGTALVVCSRWLGCQTDSLDQYKSASNTGGDSSVSVGASAGLSESGGTSWIGGGGASVDSTASGGTAGAGGVGATDAGGDATCSCTPGLSCDPQGTCAPDIAYIAGSAVGNVGASIELATPTNVVAGDLLIASIDTVVALSTPFGWNPIELGLSGSSYELRKSTFYRFAASGDPNSWTFHWSDSQNRMYTALLLAFRNANSTNPIALSEAQINSTPSMGCALPSLKPTFPNQLMLEFCTFSTDTPATVTPPVGMNGLASAQSANAMNNALLAEAADWMDTTSAATQAVGPTATVAGTSVAHVVLLTR